MNVSVQAADVRSKGYTLRKPTTTRLLDGPVKNQAINELAETLKRIMASATALLDARNCWITGLDPASQKLIPIASLPQEGSETSRLRSAQHQRVAEWVVAHRIPALINDTLSDPRCQRPNLGLGGSLLCAPLLSGQQLFGTIAVASPSLAAFQPQSLTLLQILADQTILAISKARQVEASQQQAQELAAFLDVAKAMTSTVDASQILRTIVVGIRRLVSCDDVVIFGVAEAAQELRAVARLGVSEDGLEDLRISIHDKQSIAAWVAQKRRPIIQTPGGRLFVGRVTGILLGEDDLALLSAPLLSKDHLHGVVLLTRFIPFEASELRIVLNLCNLVAIAMEHVPIHAL